MKQISKDKKAMKILRAGCEQGLSDSQIQEQILHECQHEYSKQTIARTRKKLNIEKGVISVDKEDVQILRSPPMGMAEEEKPSWFVSQFKKTHLYKNLQNQFDQTEILGYLEEYGRLCCQFEDIVFSEFFQIDDFLKHRILINRELNNQKNIRLQLDVIQKWILSNPMTEDESPHVRTERVNKYKLLEAYSASLANSTKQYESLVKERAKIFDKLAATRRDRIEELRGGKETFLSLVTQIQMSAAERQRQGKFAELSRMATHEMKDELRKEVEFPDGEFDNILMDSESEKNG